MSYDCNPYSSPEKFGLTTVGQVEWRDESYEFDLTAVWWTCEQFAWDDDAGCSCPVPFENSDMTTISCGSFSELDEHLRDHLDPKVNRHFLNDYPSQRERAEAQVVQLLLRARALTS